MDASTFTTPAEFEAAYSTLFETFASGRTKDLAWRKWQLKQCWWMISENEDAIMSALKSDLNRHAFEAFVGDILALEKDVLDTLENFEKWAADERPDAGFLLGTLGKVRVRKEPLGVALVIGAWNFPLLLLLQPMIAAIAAGCCVVLKPSELSPASAGLAAELVHKYLDRSAIRVVTGGPQETQMMLERKFNHVFFTGSSKIARFVTAATAKHLTPTVLELGGQGPAIVTATANVDLAAKRVAYAKFMNSGQICLSVNHVFVDPSVHDEFVRRLKHWFDTFMGNQKEHYVRIVNERNFDRLQGLVEKTAGNVVYGGEMDRADKFIHPLIVTDVKEDDSLFSEELFGPIVPVIAADYQKAIRTITSLSMEHPLSIYIFSSNQNEIDEILSKTNSGGVTINDVIMHAGVPNAPFGGVGEAGYGYYHGKYGFLSFSHLRTVLVLPNFLDKFMGFRYPPFDVKNIGKLRVKNRLGFKKGETLEDQREGSFGWFGSAGKTLALALAVAAVMDRKSLAKGDIFGVLNSMRGSLRQLTGY